MGGGGRAPPGLDIPDLTFDFSCWGLAGLLAMAAQDVGLGGGIPMGVAPFPVAATAGPPMTEPTALTPEP